MEEKKVSKFASRVKKLKKIFEEQFVVEPEDAFTSPGRIELLGNHTDHNNGAVFVSSIDLNILSLAKKSDDEWVIIYSQGFPLMKVNVNDLEKREEEFGESIGIVRGVLYKF